MSIGKRLLDHAMLGVDEALEIMRIGGLHASSWARPFRRERAAGALLRWRQQPCENVEKDHQRAGKQRCRYEAEADDGGVNTGIIGEAGGDAHDLGVAAVD